MVDIFGDVLNNAGGREALGLADGVLDGEGVGGAVGLDDGLGDADEGVPPTSPASIIFLKSRRPPETSTAASLVSRFFLNMALSCFAMKPPVPSMVLRKMLPE